MRARGVPTPPAVAERLLRWSLPAGVVGASIVGDLHEEYCARAVTSVWRARWWYCREAFGIGWRGVRDRIRGYGPFSSHSHGNGDNRRRDAMISNVWGALRYSMRGLVRAPQFTFAAVVTLALAIGTNAAIFSVVQGILLKPLPFEDAGRLVNLRHTAPGLGYDDIGISPGLYVTYRGAPSTFESSGLYTTSSVSLTGADAEPSRMRAGVLTRDVFVTLGVAPLAGRIFDEAEDTPGGPAVVVISEGVWRDRFGGAPVVGTTMQVDGTTRTIVGVMPASFSFPDADTRLWLPLALNEAEAPYGQFSFEALARLRADVSASEAQARLRPLIATVPNYGGDFGAFARTGQLATVVEPMKERVVGDIGRALWILLGTVACVFLIACANVTNLFLVRAESRQKEMAVRGALGAGRRGLIAHYASESLLLAAAGGALGLGLAWLAVRMLLRVAPPNIPRLNEVGIDPLVLAFTLLVSAVAALLLGILPTLRLTSPNMLATLGRSTRGGGVARERMRARNVLVVAQTALALVLLVGSGLMVRSFQNMRAVDLGFEPRDVLTFGLSLPASRYEDNAAVARFHGELLERLRATPGVAAVGATSQPPLAGCCSGTAHAIEDYPVEPGTLPPMFWFSSVTDGYFEAMRIAIVAGRSFDLSDRDPARHTVIVSERLARRYGTPGEAIGKRIRPSTEDHWYTIVGVAANVRDQDLKEEPGEMVYYPMAAEVAGDRNMTYIVRSDAVDAIAPTTRAQIWSLDADLPIARSATYEQLVADSMVRLSFTMLALVSAAVIALLLGAIGLYSVISYLVTQRRNEIGIRLALGARPMQVRRMVVLQGVRLTAVGLVLGLAAAFALTRLMQGMLFGTEPHDPLTITSVSAFLTAVALLAAYVPARRASRIDPAASLKGD